MGGVQTFYIVSRYIAYETYMVLQAIFYPHTTLEVEDEKNYRTTLKSGKHVL